MKLVAKIFGPEFFALGVGLAILFVGALQAAERFTSAYLSELAVENRPGFRDEDGDPSAWIELANGGTTPINLRGWFLTDDPEKLTRWQFPELVLLPDKYLVIFASAKNRKENLIRLHTNFRLNSHGGYLALVDRATNVISEFATYPALALGASYGRVRGEPSVCGVFARPTPGKANATAGEEFSSEVEFSRRSGNFTESFTLALSCRQREAVIRYTTDGALPTRQAEVYVSPLVITNTAQIRARAFQAGRLPGPPHSEAYIKLFTNVVAFTSTLPVLVMDTFGKEIPASSHGAFVHLSLYEPVDGKTSLTNRPTLTARGAFHIRGSTSAGMPQSSYAMHFLDEFDDEKAQEWLGLPADSDWVLYAPNGYDPVLIHNPFIHQLSRDLGRYSPRTRFIEVFVARGAGRLRAVHYQGLYVLEEKIKIGKHRVDIDRLGSEDLILPAVTGGYLLKFDRLGPGEGGFSAGGAEMVYVEPKEQVILLPQRAPQREYLTTFFDDFQRALHGAKWKDPVVGYPAYLDVKAAIDFHVLEVLSGNVDSLVFSTFFYKARNGKIIFGPHWDFDRALGSTDGRDENPRRWNTGPFFGGTWWPRMFRDPDFWQLWVDRWQGLRRTHFSTANLNRVIDRLVAEMGEAQTREYQRWDFQPRGGSYQSELRHMKNWLSARANFIDQQLAAPPGVNRETGSVKAGFLLTLSAPTNSVIYYTVDGSDPRQAQGGISSNAISYAAPIPINSTTRVTARVRDTSRRQSGGPPISTPWSSPVTAALTVE